MTLALDTPINGAPVSAVLEAELRQVVRQQGIVVWLDAAGHYTGFVDRLIRRRAAGELPFPVVGWRGSHLELMRALGTAASGVDMSPLLVHMPGFNEESILRTPILELYEPGRRYRKALETLIADAAAGTVRPEQAAAFLAQGEVTLDKADAWLAALGAEGNGGLRVQLQAMSLVAVVDDLLGNQYVAGRMGEEADRGALWHWLGAQTGVDEAWRDRAEIDARGGVEDLAYGVASWALCVEYVHDLRRPPFEPILAPMRELPRPTVEACAALAVHLRERHPAFYARTADEIEAWIPREISEGTPADLGRIDTFRFEEDRILEAALAGLDEERWDEVLGWARARVDGRSFWLRDDAQRRAAWELVGDAARLGEAIAAAGHGLPKRVQSLEEAVEHYERLGAVVDRFHRQLEQRRAALLLPQLPDFALIRDRLDGLRAAWRAWADELSRTFLAVARVDGWLPSDPALQQRALFDQVVRPMAQESGPTAYFMVDALRYEMAEELRAAIDGTPATTVHLKARLAELPTITAVGMNALTPVASAGRLRPLLRSGSFEGFQTAEFQVASLDSRRRAMIERVGGQTCPWLTLSDVISRPAPSLKQAVARANLVVVHSTEIDDAGEKGVGLAVFEGVLQKLRAAWRLLREAGVRRFVFTSDHGFLLVDPTLGKLPHGRKIDPSRRHVWSASPTEHAGEVRVPLAALAYDGVDGHLHFPETTVVYDTGRTEQTFVHGGPSLQERLIPVLTVVHRSGTGGDTLRYVVKASFAEGVAEMHCIQGQVENASQEGLSFGGARELELALRAVGRSDVAVELCQTRRGARIAGGAVVATVGESFEVFFRLVGPGDDRVAVELFHPTGAADVAAATIDARFEVVPAHPGQAQTPTQREEGWAESLPEGVRGVFLHIEEHGSLTEAEAVHLLGSPTRHRRFAMQFDELVRKVPFRVRIEFVGATKRYVREGS